MFWLYLSVMEALNLYLYASQNTKTGLKRKLCIMGIHFHVKLQAMFLAMRINLKTSVH